MNYTIASDIKLTKAMEKRTNTPKGSKANSFCNTYKINGVLYNVDCHYDGEMYEATLCDAKGNTLLFLGYGDKIGEAKYELSLRLTEKDITPGNDNIFVDWNTLPEDVKHRIKMTGKKVKTELMGEWHSEEERFDLWQICMYNTFCDIYPHRLNRSFYNMS